MSDFHFASIQEAVSDELSDELAIIQGDTRPSTSTSSSRRTGLLASYKIPRQLLVVEAVQRAPNGKADYPWARELVEQTSA